MLLRSKKVVLSPEIDRVKTLSFTRPHIGMRIRTYINFKTIKIINNKTKAEATKEEKRISAENPTGYYDIVCEFAQYTFKLLDQVVNFS